ncbi:hypothetical protein SALBM311S_07143 [Streptomyces alboniger]
MPSYGEGVRQSNEHERRLGGPRHPQPVGIELLQARDDGPVGGDPVGGMARLRQRPL